MSRPAVIWTGARAPTRDELRAIGAAWRAGRIRHGDRVSCARLPRVRRNPSPASEAYREFHCGRGPKRRRSVSVPASPEVFELGKLRAVEYETRKGNESAIWVHPFGRPFPILTGTPDGRLGPIVGGAARVTERGIVG
ncbi:MAG: hypothetical protein ACYSU7_06930 [Planctomycetota bacterium]